MELRQIEGNALNQEYVLTRLRAEARDEAIGTLTAVYLKRRAADLADMLAGQPLAEAKAAAEEPSERVRAAEEAVVDAERRAAGKLAAFWQRFKPGSGETPPAVDNADVSAAREELAAAQAAAAEPATALRLLSGLIDALRSVPGADPAALATLHGAIKGGTHATQ